MHQAKLPYMQIIILAHSQQYSQSHTTQEIPWEGLCCSLDQI